MRPGNQPPSSPHMTDRQSQTELGHSIHCPYFTYCITLYFLISVTSFRCGAEGVGGESTLPLPQGQVLRGAGAWPLSDPVHSPTPVLRKQQKVDHGPFDQRPCDDTPQPV